MKKTVGLYTEIVVTISLLLVAALLFSGFLLVRLTEEELVDQRVASVLGVTDMLARSFFAGYRESLPSSANVQDRADALSEVIASVPALNSWGLVDQDLSPQSLVGVQGGYELDMSELSQVRATGETSVRVRFPSTWNPFESDERAFVRVTSAITYRDRFMGALQGQFSLEEVRLRVLAAQRLVLLYTLIYGGILLLFGVYILNRTVVQPVRRLKKITGQVAGGDLEQVLPVAGPREIAEVATSFNHMLAALKFSRHETQDSIDSLQRANDELRQTRDELIRTEKMASVGHLAAGMAHEIGNPLGATIGYLGLLKDELEPGRPQEIVAHALTETGRIDQLVRDLLDYAAPSTESPEPLDPTEVAREACDLLSHQGAFRDISCRMALPACLDGVTMVRHKLQQVLINLLLNALDASPSGGEICLSGGENGDRIWLKVADHGEGITPAVQDHLFDPFFTTKPPGAGRGLGLAVCHRVITEAGGSIDVTSGEGAGSSFTLWLPKTSS